MNPSTRTFTWDYVTFFSLVLFSIVLGIYSKYSTPKSSRHSKTGFSFATGNVSAFVVLLSIARTGLGIRVFLGIPAEMYYYGSGMWEGVYGACLAFLIVSYIFMPVYFAMPTTSIYEYLELRFRSGTVRRLTSLLYVLRCVLMLGVTTLTPCIALHAAVGLQIWISILGVGILSILFTAIGGMRGVILNDVLQASTLFACTIAILIQACIRLPHGITEAFDLADDRERLKFFNFNPDPRVRVTTISALVGQVFISTSVYGCQQTFAQRYRSLSSRKIVVRTLLSASPAVAALESLLWVAGVAVFALYADCDPLSAGITNNIDELIPYFVKEEFAAVPGLLGLFLASLFNGSYGVAVAILNSLATVTWEDFLSKIKCVQHLSEKRQVTLIRLIGGIYGLGVMGMAAAVATLPGLFEASQLISSTTSGPLLGVFLLALLCPIANKKGAICGLIVSLTCCIVLTTGRLTVSRGPTSMLPLSVSQCPKEYNITNAVSFVNTRYNINLITEQRDDSWTIYLFSITYMYYAVAGCIICISIGLLVSFFTASTSDEYEATLIHPWAKKLSDCLPGKPRSYLTMTKTNNARNGLGSNNMQVHNEFDFVTHM